MDGGRSCLGSAICVAGPSADGGHAVDAVLRGVLRGRRVRRAVGRGGVQPAGRQPDAVHHVAQGGRGPRTVASAHAFNDSRVKASDPGRVNTEEYDCPVQGQRYFVYNNIMLYLIARALLSFP